MLLEERMQSATTKLFNGFITIAFYPVFLLAVCIGLPIFFVVMFITLHLDWWLEPERKFSTRVYFKLAEIFNF